MTVNSLDECYAFTGNVYISSFERKGKINASGYFRVFPSSKALLQPLEMTGIYLMTFQQSWKNLYVISTVCEKKIWMKFGLWNTRMRTKWLILKLFRLADWYYYCIARRRMMLHVSGVYIRGAYIRKEKHFGLRSVNFITFLFFPGFVITSNHKSWKSKTSVW